MAKSKLKGQKKTLWERIFPVKYDFEGMLHDQAVETGLLSHNRVEKAHARPDAGGQMKAAYEAALARDAFAQQRGALETITEVAFERLKQAADLIAEHVRAVASAIRLRADAVGSAEPQPPSPPSPSPHAPSP